MNSLSLLQADDGRKLGSVCVARDLTDQKKLLNTLRETNEHLLQEIVERKKIEVALQKAKEEADLATRAKSAFLANMSHEIRTPMNAVVGLSYLALKTDLTTRQRDYLNKIQVSAHNLLGLLNDILDLSKIEAGRLEIETTPFHLDHVLNNVANVVTIKVEEKGLEILFRTDPEVPRDLMGETVLARRLAHTVKGVAGNLSATGAGVTESSRQLEEAIHRDNSEQMADALKALDGAITEVIEAVAVLVPREGDAPRLQDTGVHEPPSRNKLTAIAPLLVELDGLLKKNSFAAKKCFSRIKEMAALKNLPLDFGQMENSLERLDFKEARKHLAVMLQTCGEVPS